MVEQQAHPLACEQAFGIDEDSLGRIVHPNQFHRRVNHGIPDLEEDLNLLEELGYLLLSRFRELGTRLGISKFIRLLPKSFAYRADMCEHQQVSKCSLQACESINESASRNVPCVQGRMDLRLFIHGMANSLTVASDL